MLLCLTGGLAVVIQDELATNGMLLILRIILILTGTFGIIILAVSIEHNKYIAYIVRNSLVFYALNALTLNIVKLLFFQVLRVDAATWFVVWQFRLAIIMVLFAILLLYVENLFVQRFMWWSIGKPAPWHEA